MTWTELKYELRLIDVERLVHAEIAKRAQAARVRKSQTPPAPGKGKRR